MGLSGHDRNDRLRSCPPPHPPDQPLQDLPQPLLLPARGQVLVECGGYGLLGGHRNCSANSFGLNHLFFVMCPMRRMPPPSPSVSTRMCLLGKSSHFSTPTTSSTRAMNSSPKAAP